MALLSSNTPQTKKPELLAPAGGFEQLRYALYFGADAVYLACDKFGLRQRAQNFSLADMPRAVQMAHDAGAKVYVTLNAYLHDEDLSDLPEYLAALAAAGVDAFIVSDLGVFALAREHAPQVDLHVSTQASVSNVEAARMWHRLGAKRIVTAREMSLAEIAQLKAELPDVEVEVFVQGAMCMAISGRCLISDYLTGRSANQGNCVQPCRWSYHLEEQTRPGELFPIEEDERGTYIMNSKDLNMLAHLDELIAAGVDSIKIEGRVKKAFYVATVVNAYRQVLDGGILRSGEVSSNAFRTGPIRRASSTETHSSRSKMISMCSSTIGWPKWSSRVRSKRPQRKTISILPRECGRPSCIAAIVSTREIHSNCSARIAK